MSVRGLCGVAFVVALLAAPSAKADGHLRWYTVHSPHFRVHFHGGLEETAQRRAWDAGLSLPLDRAIDVGLRTPPVAAT